MRETQERLLLTVNEAAKLVGIAEGTMYHWISEGRIPERAIVRFSSRCVRLLKSEIERWVEGLAATGKK
jgi:excisionase family DNA binding protein